MPILKDDELDIISNSAEQTARFGFRLGSLLQAGDTICLSGDMGAGKTVLSGGIGKGWGTIHQVTSPTFNLVHEHQRKKDTLKLYHLDCYRLNGLDDIETIGIDDILNGQHCVIMEWPELVMDILPKNRLWIDLNVIDSTRRNLIFEGQGERHQQLVRLLRESAYGI